MEEHRPYFMVITVGFLGAAFYFAYRPKSSDSDCYVTEGSGSDACCAPATRSTLSMLTVNKVMLWAVAAVVIAFLFFPSYVRLLFGTSNNAAVTENMDRAEFQVDGMACEGCATTVAQAIRQVPGVVAVEVSYEKKRAVVGVESGVPKRELEILAKLKKAGYTGKRIA